MSLIIDHFDVDAIDALERSPFGLDGIAEEEESPNRQRYSCVQPEQSGRLPGRTFAEFALSRSGRRQPYGHGIYRVPTFYGVCHHHYSFTEYVVMPESEPD